MRNSERAHTGAHEESKGVPVRIIVDAHTPQLIERKGMLRMFKELKRKGKEERRGEEERRTVPPRMGPTKRARLTMLCAMPFA